MRVQAERAHLSLERRLGGRIAVDDEDLLRPPRAAAEAADPLEELALVGVRREPADRADAAAHVARLPIEHDLGRPSLQVRAERALSLIADEQQRRRGILDEVAEVMEDATPGEHPVRRDDDVRPPRVLDLLRLA